MLTISNPNQKTYVSTLWTYSSDNEQIDYLISQKIEETYKLGMKLKYLIKYNFLN